MKILWFYLVFLHAADAHSLSILSSFMPSSPKIHSPGQSRCKSPLWYIPCHHTGIFLCADKALLSRLTFLRHLRLRSGQTPVSSLSHLAPQLTERLANGSLLLQPKMIAFSFNDCSGWKGLSNELRTGQRKYYNF